MRRASLKLLWTAGLVLCVSSAHAQANEPDGNLDLARKLGNTAGDLLDDGDYQGAINAVHEAEKHTRALTLTLIEAEAHAKMNKLIEAQKLYQKIVIVNIAELKPPKANVGEWRIVQKETHATATKDLLELTPRIPLLRVTVSGAEPSTLKVTLDGEPFDLTQLDQEVQRNPGKHTVTAEAPGTNKVTREVDLKEGAKETVSLTLTPVPKPDEGRSMPIGAIVAFGVGGAGLVVGAIAGGIAFSEASKRSEVCGTTGSDMSDKTCREEYLYPMLTVSRISTVGFGVAVAGAAVGTILYLMPSKKVTPKPVGVAVGLGFVSVSGRF